PATAGDVHVDSVLGSDATGDGSAAAPWQTLTFALAQVAAGDVVHVGAGVHDAALGESFPIVVPLRVEVRGAGIGSTVIDGDGADELVIVIGDWLKSEQLSLSGMTLTDAGVGLGVGAVLTPAGARVERVEVTNVELGVKAGGVASSYGLRLEDCLVHDCVTGFAAGAISSGGGGSVSFVGGEIRDCSEYGAYVWADVGGKGWGYLARARVSGCGIALVASGQDTAIDLEQSLVSGCHAAASLWHLAWLRLRGSTLTGNGAGISFPVTGFERIELDGSIVWGNGFYDLDPAMVVSARYSNTNPLLPGTGNLAVDPRFLDPQGGDFHLAPGSPLVDVGDPALPPGGTDLDGDPRVLDGDSDLSSRVDIGHDERNPVALGVSGTPVLGATLGLDVAAPAGWFAFAAVALDTADLALGPFGSLLVDPFASVPLGSGPAPWSGTLSLPPDPVLAGLELFLQALGVDLPGGAGSFSNRVELAVAP
ncbi:MAG TPA: DUF1565 domain-containing protein, partial [Planctomycetota bacterium]|nr:DUF1565 domain-containing protein [Planctomycetota bacterium]